MSAVSFTTRPLYPRGESSVRPLIRRIRERGGLFGSCEKEPNVYRLAVWSVDWEFIYIRVTRHSVAQNIQRRSVTKQLIGNGVAEDCLGVI